MPDKYIIQRRTASGLETVAELPALESGKIDMSWLPVVGAMGSAIIESGSNANGEYIRWADGTQVCCIKKDTKIGEVNQWATYTATYPAMFASIPTSLVNIGLGADASDHITCTHGGTSSSAMTFHIKTTAASYVGGQATTYILAIGRWK